MSIEIKNVSKKFGDHVALDQINLKVEEGKLMALLGPSGCGKTTLLRIIAGLEQPDDGEITIEGRDVTWIPPRERNVGFVFQNYALFPHLSVFENIAFGLQVLKGKERPSRIAIKERVQELLAMVQMDWAGKRMPSQLSGGQRQRIALARALAVRPTTLLLDEPFSALDAKVRQELRRWLRKLHDDLHVTSVFVTHDQEEAIELADRVAILHGGKIEQEGTPEDVYEQPATQFVYGFLGQANIFNGNVQDGRLRADAGPIDLPEGHGFSNGAGARVYVRPHDIILSREKIGDDQLHATITSIKLLGGRAVVELQTEGQYLEADLSRDDIHDESYKKGDSVWVNLKKVRVFHAEEYTI